MEDSKLIKLSLSHRNFNEKSFQSKSTTSRFNEIDKEEAMKKLLSYNFKSTNTPPPSLKSSWSSDCSSICSDECKDQTLVEKSSVNVVEKLLKNLQYNNLTQLVQHNYNNFENVTIKSPYYTSSTKLINERNKHKVSKKTVHKNNTLSISINRNHSEQRKISLYDLGSDMKVFGFSPKTLRKSIETNLVTSSKEIDKTRILQPFNLLRTKREVRFPPLGKRGELKDINLISFEKHCKPIDYRLNLKPHKSKM